ncbi:MAG: class IV adenylate cyclase [Caldivirga sp.]|uniref:class IV adenylate cyclase n=1 Tax=Caldivirga sp. TaxID=2080243 RepID=UPI003D0FB128
MFEVEVKFRVSNVDDVISKLRGFATYVGSDVEEDHYFNHPCRDFAATDEAVRVRLYGSGKVTVTYKGPRLGGEGKVRVEYNIDVDSASNTIGALKELGFREIAVIRKERTEYTYGSYTIYVDKVNGLGNFIEIETLTNDQGIVSELVKSIVSFAERALGVKKDSVEPKTYLELMLSKISEGK